MSKSNEQRSSEDAFAAERAAEAVWRRGNGTNLVGVPSEILGSAEFNTRDRGLRIAGVREMNAELFQALDSTADAEEASAIFSAYMEAQFGPPKLPANSQSGKPRHYRSSYLRLLRGWAYDSNSPEGAVLKGWVESRFGLFPTYHKEPLRRFTSGAWALYVEEKMGSRFHNNAIHSQIDLLYEFAQWTLRRDGLLPRESQGHWRLFRGINDFEEHQIVARLDRRRVVLRLNNLVSFTTDRDVASCFGDRILETDIPRAKIVFFNSLLPRHALKGEDEVLAIGGDYLVTARTD